MTEGTPEQAAEFRAILAALGYSVGALTRLMEGLGDPRQPLTIRRSLERMASGDVRVSGEMWVMLNLLKRLNQRDSAFLRALEGGCNVNRRST